MRRSILAMACVIASAPAAAQTAPQPGTIATARVLVAQMRMERVLDPMFAQLTPLMVSNVTNAMRAASDTPAALRTRLATDAGRQQVGAIISAEFGSALRARYPAIAEATAEEYRKTFSESELATIIAFYRSPTGAKMLDAQPQLQKALSEAGQGVGREAAMAAFPKIQARIVALDAPAAK